MKWEIAITTLIALLMTILAMSISVTASVPPYEESVAESTGSDPGQGHEDIHTEYFPGYEPGEPPGDGEGYQPEGDGREQDDSFQIVGGGGTGSADIGGDAWTFDDGNDNGHRITQEEWASQTDSQRLASIDFSLRVIVEIFLFAIAILYVWFFILKPITWAIRR